MDLNSALDIIIKDLREAREIISDLRNYKGVPAIQVELAKAKCKSAEEIITLLKTLYPSGNEKLPAEESPAVQTTEMKVNDAVSEESSIKSEPVFAEALPENESRPAKPVKEAPPVGDAPVTEGEALSPRKYEQGDEKKAGPSVPAEPGKDKIIAPESESDTVAPAGGKRVSAGKGETGRPILADRFGEVENRINESVHGRRPEDDISSRIKQSPISNLADAIGINDRFYFTREIFGGNGDSYRNAIGRLNNASGLREAEGIIQECAGNDSNPEAVRELLALVKRKTGSDE